MDQSLNEFENVQNLQSKTWAAYRGNEHDIAPRVFFNLLTQLYAIDPFTVTLVQQAESKDTMAGHGKEADEAFIAFSAQHSDNQDYREAVSDLMEKLGTSTLSDQEYALLVDQVITTVGKYVKEYQTTMENHPELKKILPNPGDRERTVAGIIKYGMWKQACDFLASTGRWPTK